MAKGSLGRYGAPFGLQNIYSNLSKDINSMTSNKDHAEGTYAYNPVAAQFGDPRAVAFEDLMTPEELTIHKTRVGILADTGNVDTEVDKLRNGSTFNMTFKQEFIDKYQKEGGLQYLKDYKYYETKALEQEYAPVVNNELFDDKYYGKRYYASATLVEFLLQLSQKISFKGGFGSGRGATGPAFGDPINGGGFNAFISDHGFFRGFDIGAVGKKGEELINFSDGMDGKLYEKAVEILLNAMNAIPEYLQPDSFIIDDDLKDKYGIVEGFESINNPSATVNKTYKNLTRVNYHSKPGHKDHIHISFGPQRAGSYSQWAGSAASLFPQSSNSSSLDSSSGIVPGTLPRGNPSDFSEVWERFETRTTQITNLNSLYVALRFLGQYSEGAAAIWMCLAERESNLSPAGFNGGVEASGDYSLGLWQVNFYGVKSLLTHNFPLPYKDSTGRIVTETLPGYKILFKDWQSLGINSADSAIAKMREIEKNGKRYGKSLMDPRALSAGAQIAMLPPMSDYRRDGWMFWNWGEYEPYGGEKGTGSGWFFKLKFTTAADFYCQNNPGKTTEDLRNWCRTNLDRNLPSTKLCLEDWMKRTDFQQRWKSVRKISGK